MTSPDGPQSRTVIRLGAPDDAAAIAALHAESCLDADTVSKERFVWWQF